MRIKLALLDSDDVYVSKLVGHLNLKYPDGLEIYAFSSAAALREYLEKEKIDVLLCSETFDIDPSALPRSTAFAYFSDSPAIDTIKGMRTICRYQKFDLIYKEILGLYSELSTNVTSYKSTGTGTTNVILFLPVSGGVGATTIAAAAAIHVAGCGKRVLYIDFQQCGAVAAIFHSEGQYTFSDVIYAIKSNKSNLKLRLESMVRNAGGVFYFESCPVALDAMAATEEDLTRLIRELIDTGSYDYIFIDMDNHMDKKLYDIIRLSQALVFVGDGSELSNAKFQKYYEALLLLNGSKKLNISNKMLRIYNKFSSKTSRELVINDIRTIGGVPRFELATAEQIVLEISKMKVFDTFLA